MTARRVGHILFLLTTFVFIGGFVRSVHAGEVRGAQSGRWTLANSPYVVTGNIVVPSDMTLTIEAGVVVKFAGYFSFKVEGTLRALGLPQQRIVFTSSKDQDFVAPRAETILPTPNDWYGLEFTDNSNDEQSRVENCWLKHCRRPLTLNQAYPKLESITISRSGVGQIMLNGNAVAFEDGVERDYFVSAPEHLDFIAPADSNRAASVEGNPALGFGEMKLDTYFDLHGYFETQFEVDNKDAEGRKSDIDMQRLNIVTTFNFAERAFVLAEVEYEHGAELSGNGGVGLIALERGELHLKLHANHSLIIGKFLTPYGIYNLLHDNSPSYIFTRLPFSLYDRHANASGKSERDYPKFLAGALLNGTLPLFNGEVEYFFYVGNGKGATPYERDDNHNKAVGMRLRFAEHSERIKLGVSAFRGRNGADANSMQQIGAGDLELNLLGLKLQTEATVNEFDRLDAKGKFLGWQRRALGAYVQGSLEMFGRIQPFARYDHYDPDIDLSKDLEIEGTAGFNINLMKDVFLKMEVHHRRGETKLAPRYELFIASLAAGF